MNTTITTDFLDPSFTDTNLTAFLHPDETFTNQSSHPPPKTYNTRSFTSSTLIPLLICGIFGIGSVGNALIIFVISKSKNLRQTATNIYILNMAITDLLFVSSLPLFALQYAMNMQWPFGGDSWVGNFVCKSNRMLTRLNLFCTIYFVMALAIHRWMMVNPKKSASVMQSNLQTASDSAKKAKQISFYVWIAGFIISIPDFVYSSVRHLEITNSSVCAFGPEMTSNATKNEIQFFLQFMGYWDVAHFILTYLLPSSVVLICYILLIRIVNKKLIVSSRTKSASRTVITVVVAYYICWTPYNIHKILRSVCGYLQGCSAETTGVIQAFFRPIEPFLIVLAFSNSCLNPIIYAFTLDQFNDSLIKVFCGRRAQAQYRHNIASKREEGLHLKRNQPRSPEKYQLVASRQGRSGFDDEETVLTISTSLDRTGYGPTSV